MKKFFIKLSCVLIAVVGLLTSVGCVDNFGQSERIECAPCSVREIYQWNEKVFKEMWYLRQSAMANASPKVTVNGTELTKMEYVMGEDLAEGEYTIVFATPENFVITEVETVNGEVVRTQKPYNRSVTIKVIISNEYPDICDMEYRIANGLWIDPMTQDWYKQLLEQYQK